MYGTKADEDALAQAGFVANYDEMLFSRFTPQGVGQFITAVWATKRPGDMSVPAPQYVFWVATTYNDSMSHPMGHVVPFDDRAQTPLSCYVQAEVRAWQPVESMKAR